MCHGSFFASVQLCFSGARFLFVVRNESPHAGRSDHHDTTTSRLAFRRSVMYGVEPPARLERVDILGRARDTTTPNATGLHNLHAIGHTHYRSLAEKGVEN